MKKLLSFLVMLTVSIGVWAEGTATVADNTVTFDSYAAGEIAQISNWDSYKNKAFVFTNSTLNSDDVAAVANTELSVTSYNFYGATATDANDALKSLISNAAVVVLPLNCTLTDAELESYTINDNSKLKYLARFTDDGKTAYLSYKDANNGPTAVYGYLANVTNLTINANGSTTNASDFSKWKNSGTVTKMTVKNGYINGDISFSSSAVKSVTLSNVAIHNNNNAATLTFTDCGDLEEINLVNGTWMDSLAINNCKDLDHVDLKAAVLGRTSPYYFDGVVDGGISITNNANLRYIILPHNYAKASGCDVTTGNTDLYAVIATAYLSEKVYDEDGNVLKGKDQYGNPVDSTRWATRVVDGKEQYLLTANYNIYKGGIPDDMMAIAQSMPYYQCTVHCREAIEGSNATTKTDSYGDTRVVLSTSAVTGTDEKHTQTASDMDGMNKFQAEIFDISRTIYDDPTKVVATNPYVEWLILPDNMDYVLSQSVIQGNTDYKTLESRVEGCDKLKGAVSYCGDPDQGNGNSDVTSTIHGIMTATAEPGKVDSLLNITYHKWDDVVTAYQFFNGSSITNLVMVGKLNARDLWKNGTNLTGVADNGNYEGGAAVTVGNHVTLGSLTRLDLTRAVFPVNNDMRIGQLVNYTAAALKEIYLPIGKDQKLLPDSCLWGVSALDSLCIPGNFQEIGSYAVDAVNHVFTTAISDGGDGYPIRTYDTKYDTEKIIDMWEYKNQGITVTSENAQTYGGAITISENVTKIGTHAFNSKYFKDVYAMGTKAPKCAFNAFTSNAYVCNNSYNANGIAEAVTRDNYYSSQDGWRAYLHFPETCSPEEKAHYTDTTRVYSIPDADGRTDGEGNIVMWPTQSEWNRSYNQAVAGVTWQYWKDDTFSEWTYDENTKTDVRTTDYSNTAAGFPLGDKTYADWGAEPWNGVALLAEAEKSYPNWKNDASATYLAGFGTDEVDVMNDYMGWHQFTLAYTTAATGKKYTEFTQRGWYTLCVPTDLTRAEVLEYFGAPAGSTIDGEAVSEDTYPDIRTLYGVTRSIDKEKITFNYTDNLCNGKAWDFFAEGEYSNSNLHYIDAANDGDVVVYAGCPYIIKAIIPTELNTETNVSRYLLSRYNGEKHSVKSDEEGSTVDYKMLPYHQYSVTATRVENGSSSNEKQIEGDNKGEDFYYNFIGTYYQSTIPQWAYYSSVKKNGNIGWYQNKSGKAYKWNPYTCLKGALGSTELIMVKVKFADGVTTTYYKVKYSDTVDDHLFDADGNTISANYAVAFGHEDEEAVVTGITEVEAEETAEAVAGNDKVYTIGGQLVNGKTLQKGIYIKNGKKFVVE